MTTATRPPVRTVLFGCLTAATTVVVGFLVARMWEPRVSMNVLLPAVAVFVAINGILRLRRDDLGGEGRYVDLWSIPHVMTGMLFALVGVDLLTVAIVAISWELVELSCRVYEYPTNRIADLVLAVGGWLAVDAFA